MRRIGLLVVLILSAGAGIAAVSAIAQAPAAGDETAGADVYSVRCAFCHGDTGAGGQGPSLIGVVGRKAASVPGFGYSPALKAADITWTPAQLDRFLTNPATAVPGTAMPMSVPDQTDRRNLIAYLGTLH
jgi:cytochrome c2